MKKTILFLLFSALFGLLLNAQNDTMYIMKNGAIVGRYNVSTDVDSLIYYLPTRGVFTDSRDGNTYDWVKIGTQVWMAENLKYLPSVVGPTTGSFTIPYYYVLGYYGTSITEAKATANYNDLGVLYNWTAAVNGSNGSNSVPSGVQGACPNGWHLPSHSEWSILINYLGGDYNAAGGKLKEVGTTHWIAPNTGATNETGFTGFPSGSRDHDGTFNFGFHYATWWSSYSETSDIACYRFIYWDPDRVHFYCNHKDIAQGIRCLKN